MMGGGGGRVKGEQPKVHHGGGCKGCITNGAKNHVHRGVGGKAEIFREVELNVVKRAHA